MYSRWCLGMESFICLEMAFFMSCERFWTSGNQPKVSQITMHGYMYSLKPQVLKGRQLLSLTSITGSGCSAADLKCRGRFKGSFQTYCTITELYNVYKQAWWCFERVRNRFSWSGRSIGMHGTHIIYDAKCADSDEVTIMAVFQVLVVHVGAIECIKHYQQANRAKSYELGLVLHLH